MFDMICSNSNIPIPTAHPIDASKQSVCVDIPGQASKLINCRQNHRRTSGIYFLIYKIDRYLHRFVSVFIEDTILIRAVNLYRLLLCIDIEIIFTLQRSPTKRTCEELFIYQIFLASCLLCFLRIFGVLNHITEAIGCNTSSNPKSNTDWLFTILGEFFLANHFSCNNHFGNAIPLLRSKQAQCIS